MGEDHVDHGNVEDNKGDKIVGRDWNILIIMPVYLIITRVVHKKPELECELKIKST